MARACLRVLAWFDPQWPSLKMGVACLNWRECPEHSESGDVVAGIIFSIEGKP